MRSGISDLAGISLVCVYINFKIEGAMKREIIKINRGIKIDFKRNNIINRNMLLDKTPGSSAGEFFVSNSEKLPGATCTPFNSFK